MDDKLIQPNHHDGIILRQIENLLGSKIKKKQQIEWAYEGYTSNSDGFITGIVERLIIESQVKPDAGWTLDTRQTNDSSTARPLRNL